MEMTDFPYRFLYFNFIILHLKPQIGTCTPFWAKPPRIDHFKGVPPPPPTLPEGNQPQCKLEDQGTLKPKFYPI